MRGEGGNIDAIVPLWQPWWEIGNIARPLIDVSDAPTTSPNGAEQPIILSNIPPIDKMAKVKPSPNLVYNLLDIL